MRRALPAVVVLLAACEAALPRAQAPSPAPSALATLRPVWDRAIDTQAALVVLGDRIAASGWEGIVFRAVDDGEETARSAESPGFRAWIDSPHDPVLFELGAFVIASGRSHALARFDRDATSPRWIADGCTRAFVAARLGTSVAMLCQDELLLFDAESGALVRTLPAAPTSWMDEHAAVEVDGGIVVRSGETLLGFADDGHERFRVSARGTFGLAPSGGGFVVVSLADGLVERSESTGEVVRAIAIPDLAAYPDPMSSRLGRVIVDGDLALVASAGVVRAIALAAGGPSWVVHGADAVLTDDAVYLCAGVRVLAVERASGIERWSWSVGSCEMVGVAGGRVLVRHEATGPIVYAADTVYQGVIAFSTGAAPIPCEEVTVHGTVALDGVPAPGLHVRAGVASSPTQSGAVIGWGSRVVLDPGATAPTDVAVTDAAGAYALHLCDHGHVPITVEHSDIERASGQPEAEGWATWIHLDGRGDYPLDFAITPHAETL